MSTLPPRLVWTRRVLVCAGIVALGYAVTGAVASPDTRFSYVRFLALALIGHELILVPLAIGAGVVIGRFVPVVSRPLVQAAALISAAIAIVAMPAVTGYGRSHDLPSALPRDYGRGLLTVLAMIWLAAGTKLAVQALRRHHNQRQQQ